MGKKILAVVLALLLIILSLALRWFYFYEGIYKPGQVARPDMGGIESATPEVLPFADSLTTSTPGIVLVDLAHDNRFEMTELSVLQARLSARGLQIELVEAADELGGKLRYAKALVVISPGQDWAPGEIEQIQAFVERGGRLLLVADATRFEMYLDASGSVGFDHDAAHINGLAARFGVTFRSDYLYNTFENAGNFRNIELTGFGDHILTDGLERVVFSAARSLVSEQSMLIATSGETRSSSSERIEEMPVAVLAGDGQVLALGDLSFMTEAYHAVYDNDRLVANISDFLSAAQREYTLADFPFFFDEEIDLIYAGDPLLDSDLLESGSDLQALFEGEGKDLKIREEEDDTRDTLFFGLYEHAEEVEPYLAAANVTLIISPTEQTRSGVEEGSGMTLQSASLPASSSSITEEVTATLTMSPALVITATPVVTAASEITVTAEISPGVKNRVAIESLGEMVLTGTSLLLLQTEEERQVLVVLADTEEGLASATLRLMEGNLEDCLLHETGTPPPMTWALCPTGELAPGDGEGGWQEPVAGPAAPAPTPTPPITDSDTLTETVEPPEPVGEPEGSIVIIALDEGQGRYDSMTSAGDYAAVLGERYDVTVWNKAEKGSPSIDELLEYDLVIWTAGDYVDAFGDDEGELFFLLVMEGIPVLVSGAYIGDTDVESVQRDIQVTDASHPLAEGFGAEEVIDFSASPSGSEYEISVIEDMEEEDIIVFVRGPASEDAGAPSAFVLEDEFTGERIAFIGFPLYLLPEGPRSQLIVNAVSWLLSP